GVGGREPLASIRGGSNGESVMAPARLRAALEPEPAPPAPAPLSHVELDLLRLIAAGLTNRQIAGRLRWSQATVKKYVQRLLEKLDVSDRTQAAVEGVRRGLLD